MTLLPVQSFRLRVISRKAAKFSRTNPLREMNHKEHREHKAMRSSFVIFVISVAKISSNPKFKIQNPKFFPLIFLCVFAPLREAIFTP